MAIDNQLRYENIDNLFLDPMNPRLGRHRTNRKNSQEKLLNIMRTWVLDELAYSYLESGGFWTHEPLIVVKELLYGDSCLVVVEGNRRLAALKYLFQAVNGKPFSRKWRQMSEELEVPEGLFEKIPYVLSASREDVQAFLGFRHVTGIKQWDANEKAGFIAKLINENNLSYQQVARKIGSKAPTVRKHYIAFQMMLQIEENVEDFDSKRAENRFAILYMSINTQGVQEYLNLDITVEPSFNKCPVPKKHLNNLAYFAKWLFGLSDVEPIINDTRRVSDFGKILESKEAVEYIEETKQPKFEIAYRIAGGDEEEIIRYIREASNNVELSLTRAHVFKKSEKLKKEVKRLGLDTVQLLNIFPKIKEDVLKDDSDD